MADADADPFDGVTLDYVNPLDGGPTLPTLQCRLHRLLAGHRTRRHRHTWNSIFHVVEGEGETTVGDSTFKWAAHDVISVPAWQWHQHRCAKGSEAIVFSVSDDPVFRAFGLDRVEAV
jgi:gentisate 1,2-dioxygenase